jgi:hypothetical protein
MGSNHRGAGCGRCPIQLRLSHLSNRRNARPDIAVGRYHSHTGAFRPLPGALAIWITGNRPCRVRSLLRGVAARSVAASSASSPTRRRRRPSLRRIPHDHICSTGQSSATPLRIPVETPPKPCPSGLPSSPCRFAVCVGVSLTVACNRDRWRVQAAAGSAGGVVGRERPAAAGAAGGGCGVRPRGARLPLPSVVP